jgi:hypothetical protein
MEGITMKSQSKLEKMLMEIASIIDFQFKYTGEMFSTVHAMWDPGNPAGAPPGDAFFVVESMDEVTKFVTTVKPTRYIFMSQGWCIEGNKERITALADSNASDHEDRREMILFDAHEGEEHIYAMFYVLRPEHGKPKLSRLHVNYNDNIIIAGLKR